MSESPHPNDDRPHAHLDGYLDGLLPEAEQAAWADRLGRDAALRRDAALQRRVDDALRNQFPTATPSAAHLAEVACLQSAGAGIERRRRPWRGALPAAAALLFAAWVAWMVSSSPTPHRQPFFEPTPLAEIYRDALGNGFEPYYECREEERFTAIFADRLGVRMRLLPMPPGSRMLGLSYPGGLSRDTTAMLCRVDDEPVLVAVDRQQVDRQQPPPGAYQGRPLHLHRNERSGLVFYEVSPFAEPRAMQYLVPTARRAPVD